MGAACGCGSEEARKAGGASKGKKYRPPGRVLVVEKSPDKPERNSHALPMFYMNNKTVDKDDEEEIRTGKSPSNSRKTPGSGANKKSIADRMAKDTATMGA